jgi:hypothetical protein
LEPALAGGVTVLGIDFSTKMVAVARSLHPRPATPREGTFTWTVARRDDKCL